MEKEKLIKAAVEARKAAYAPYSHYQVGAALLTKSGEIITGCNIENAAYTPTVCAERVAIFKAVSEGKKEFQAIAVVTKNGGTPCGVCRQVMSEFMLDGWVLVADEEGNLIQESTVDALLPGAFTPSKLG
ncbi:MAG: cytidine deaminase [Anaerolineaceae bacterium]|nr:cytidine deaminase [Anaerolineaceae bacterium]